MNYKKRKIRKIKDFPGYKITVCGEVISTKKGKTVVKANTVCQQGYKTVSLWHNNFEKRFYVHRLIGEYFIENPFNLGVINHIDLNKLNCSLDNLEWVTQAQNVWHARENGVQSGMKRVPVFAVSKSGCIMEYDSIMQASRATGVFQSQVHRMCNGTAHTAKGYTFLYAKDVLNAC